MSARRGLRVPGTWDPFEVGVRAIVGQQVSVAGATTVTGRIVERHGPVVAAQAWPGLHRAFPSAATLADADLVGLGLTGARVAAISTFAGAVADGTVRLDRSVGLGELIASLASLRGLGPWTAHYIALRMGEPDAFPATDLVLRRSADALLAAPDGASLAARAEAWRPWRALAAVHLWAAAAT